jgi:hypothetical protein
LGRRELKDEVDHRARRGARRETRNDRPERKGESRKHSVVYRTAAKRYNAKRNLKTRRKTINEA